MVLGIYGYGGLGREVFIIANKINKIENRWQKIIFIDDATGLETSDDIEIFNFNKSINEFTDIEMIVGVGNPATRELLLNRIKAVGAKVATLIHPGVYIDKTTKIGEGTVICEGVTITCNVDIGEGSYIQPHAVIGHDISIGRCSVISSNSQIGGANKIGDRFYIGFNGGTKELLTIGNDVICSAGAIVFRDLPDDVIAVGNPARIMKKNEDKRVF